MLTEHLAKELVGEQHLPDSQDLVQRLPQQRVNKPKRMKRMRTVLVPQRGPGIQTAFQTDFSATHPAEWCAGLR